MAYYKIEKNKKGKLRAKIQVSCKDYSTGKAKLFTKTIYNTDNFTEPRFTKHIERETFLFEEELIKAYETQVRSRTKVLTFNELVEEWKITVKRTLSHNYLLRISDVQKKFNNYLMSKGLYNSPISDIRVRDVQLFFNECLDTQYRDTKQYKLKKELPVKIPIRDKKHLDKISEKRVKELCEKYDIYLDKYFEKISTSYQYSVVTIKNFRTMLRTIFNEAVRFEWITKNPVCFTKITSTGNNSLLTSVSEKEVFSIKESQAFLASLDEEKECYMHRVIPIKIMLLAGLRNGEIHGLKWSDIDFDKKVIHVVRARLYSQVIGCYEKDPKTRTSIRDVPMPDYLINELEEYKNWFRLVDNDFDNKLDKYYIASNLYREPINPTSLDKWLTDFEEKTGQKHVTCHGLRHTYCSLLLAQNVPIQTVSRYMGHSDSTITLKVYSHFIPDTQEIAVDALNKILKNEGEN